MVARPHFETQQGLLEDFNLARLKYGFLQGTGKREDILCKLLIQTRALEYGVGWASTPFLLTVSCS